MFGELAIAYLFLGGVGAGCICICCVVDMTFLRQPFGVPAYRQGLSVNPCPCMVDYSFAAAAVILAAGAACLLFDLGRMDRLASLFLHPRLNWMTVGAYSIALLLACAIFLSLVRFLYLPQVPRTAVVTVEAIACILGLVVMVYTGFLLKTLAGVALWRSIWLPVLFLFSSLSGGTAVVILAGAFVVVDAQTRLLAKRLAAVDAAFIALEVLSAIAFVLFACLGENPGAQQGAFELIAGQQALLWWIGFIGCGVAVPLVAETVFLLRWRHAASRGGGLLVSGAICVLLGALALRVGIVQAGELRPLSLQRPPEASAFEEAPQDNSPAMRLDILSMHEPSGE